MEVSETDFSSLHIAVQFVEGVQLGIGLVTLRGQCGSPCYTLEHVHRQSVSDMYEHTRLNLRLHAGIGLGWCFAIRLTKSRAQG